ncbi:MAG: hypothetical protein ABIY37_12455, partial [Devosia sp.]
YSQPVLFSPQFIARTVVDANDAMDMRVGKLRGFPGPCGGCAGNPSPIAHVILKSRAPRRLRLYYN